MLSSKKAGEKGGFSQWSKKCVLHHQEIVLGQCLSKDFSCYDKAPVPEPTKGGKVCFAFTPTSQPIVGGSLQEIHCRNVEPGSETKATEKHSLPNYSLIIGWVCFLIPSRKSSCGTTANNHH